MAGFDEHENDPIQNRNVDGAGNLRLHRGCGGVGKPRLYRGSEDAEGLLDVAIYSNTREECSDRSNHPGKNPDTLLPKDLVGLTVSTSAKSPMRVSRYGRSGNAASPDCDNDTQISPEIIPVATESQSLILSM